MVRAISSAIELSEFLKSSKANGSDFAFIPHDPHSRNRAAGSPTPSSTRFALQTYPRLAILALDPALTITDFGRLIFCESPRAHEKLCEARLSNCARRT